MEAYPKEFYCPITQEVMQDPMIGPDGQTYEREAIENWLQIHHTSPITRVAMDAAQLIPNYALKNTIQGMLHGKPAHQAVPAVPMPAPVIDNLDIKLGAIEESHGKGVLHVSVVPPPEGNRKPSAIICMIDTSGSMGDADTTEKKETEAFSTLDMIKHSVKTIISIMEPNDHLALISFSDAAKVVLDLMPMSELGKKSAAMAVDSLFPEHTTNIWDALRVAVNIANENPVCKDLNTSLWLFTDGKPTLNPPRGVVPTLAMYLEDRPANFTINTFGFGYDLDSRLLYDIATMRKGIFCYIPDCNLVGTTFVNCLANTISTATNRAVVELKTEGLEPLHSVGYPMKDGVLEVGTLQYGQTRDFILRFKRPYGSFKITATLKYEGGKTLTKELTSIDTDSKAALYHQFARCQYAETIDSGLSQHRSGKSGNMFLNELEKFIDSLPCHDDDYLMALIRDLSNKEGDDNGRVTKAFTTKERMDRWGRHYLRSIIRAHQLQQCHNFKDPGVQLYGGKLFKKLQYKGEMIFCSLPPPVPSVKKAPVPVPVPVAGAQAPPAVPAMQEYMDCGGGCFGGCGWVTLLGGEMRQVRGVKKGDMVCSVEGVASRVVCVVEFPLRRAIPMVDINGNWVTPKHPVLVDGEWKFPRSIGAVENVACGAVYNFVLEQNHVVGVNGVDLVTLGHGKHENTTVEHAYYGSAKAVQDLQRKVGWEDGKVEMEGCVKLKDPFTGVTMAIH